MKLLKVENLTFGYNKRSTVLDDISVVFTPNQIHTLLGINGSGKTTLIKLLAGLLTPNRGLVYLENQDLHSIDYLTRSKHIAYVQQGATTGDDHLVKDYLTFGMMNQLSWYQSPKKSHFDYVTSIGRDFSILHLLDKKMSELSGGERQLATICRAFIQNTDVIILDEPTSALDVKNQSMILRTIKKIVNEKHKTVILSTHNPNHALFLDSNVVLLDKGKIIIQGKANVVINIDELKKVYGQNLTYSDQLSYREITIT